MRKFTNFFAALLILQFILLSVPVSVRAEDPVHPFTDLPDHFLHAFTGYKLAFQISAVGATTFFILNGTDGNIYNAYSSGASDGLSGPAYSMGVFVAPAVAATMYLFSDKSNHDDLYVASMAGLQASLVALGYTTTLKFFTGRPIPGEFSTLDVYEQSRYFRPGFGRGGIYNGWPSGHAMGAAAFTSALASYYESPALWVAAGIFTAYISWGMTAGTRGTEHWFSDTIAGSLMGYSIGSTIGEEFRSHGPRGQKGAGEKLTRAIPKFEPHFLPMTTGDGGLGLRAMAVF